MSEFDKKKSFKVIYPANIFTEQKRHSFHIVFNYFVNLFTYLGTKYLQ